MHILEIDNLIIRLEKSRNSLIEIVKHDGDYRALMQGQSHDQAANPGDIIGDFGLRAKFIRKYGGRPAGNTMFKLDQALEQFEQELESVSKPILIADQAGEKNFAKVKESSLNDESICRQAAARALALAQMNGAQITDGAADIIGRGAAPIDNILRFNIGKKDLSLAAMPTERSEKNQIDADPTIEDIDSPHGYYLPIYHRVSRLGRDMAYTIIALMTVIIFGATFPESASASRFLFQSIKSMSINWLN